MPLSILAVTGSRADWGLLAPVLAALRDDPAFSLHLAVTGQHLTPGSASLAAILEDGFTADYRITIVSADDSAAGVTKSMGLALIGFADLLTQARPDLMLLLGDRYEIHAAASAALIARLPVAHLCGGDVTEGAIDDAFRHGLTKMAHLHFVSNADAARRVAQLGEPPERIHNVGSPGLDRIRQARLLDRDAFFASIGLAPRERNLLVTFHPVTLAQDSDDQCRAMLEALAAFPDAGLIFTGSNADPGGRGVDALLEGFARGRDNAVLVPSLGSQRYFSALRHVDALIGNSSSGLYEAPSFDLPAVNIGARQKGRPRARSVIDCDPDVSAVTDAIRAALVSDYADTVNPYGDGHAAPRIVEVLRSINNPVSLLAKGFRDMPP